MDNNDNMRKVRMKVRSWLHVALHNLRDGEMKPRREVLPKCAVEWTAKPLERLLCYGLIEHTYGMPGPYWITEHGLRVLEELDAVDVIIGPKILKGIEVSKTNTGHWTTVDGEQMWMDWGSVIHNVGYYKYSGYRMIITEVPENEYWKKYFKDRSW